MQHQYLYLLMHCGLLYGLQIEWATIIIFGLESINRKNRGMNMKVFFEVLEEHSDAAIFIELIVYMLADCITSNLRKK